MHCHGGNATYPIWWELASSDRISSWTQHSNPNPLANQLCYFLTLPTPFIIPHRLPGFLESLMPLKNWFSIHASCSKCSLKHPIYFFGVFSKFKTEYYSTSFLKVSDYNFEIHQLWQSGFIRVYSNSCCSCSFKPEIIKIGQWSLKIYSNNILNFQAFTTIFNAHTKIVWKLIVCSSYIYIYIYVCVCVCVYACVCLCVCMCMAVFGLIWFGFMVYRTSFVHTHTHIYIYI